MLLTQASGTSRVHEAVFEDRIEWLAELRKLGARIDIEDPHHASIHGPARLHGGEAPSATSVPVRRSSSPPSLRTERR